MKKIFYNANYLNQFITWDEFKSLKKIKLLKGEQMYTETTFFIIKGIVEVSSIDVNGESIKLRSLTPKHILLGIVNLLSDSPNFLHYTAKEDTILLELSPDKNIYNLGFFKFLLKILGRHFENFTQSAILTNNYSCQMRLKIFLKQEMDDKNIINLKNPGKFLEKYNFSRTTFYRELKKLENLGWLNKKGTIIKINDCN